tara:strand:+ start:2603 stop:2929 length:327 start_codon:yes stop_codon:yes gene_type:complete
MYDDAIFLTKIHIKEIYNTIERREFYINKDPFYSISYLNCTAYYFIEYLGKKIDLYNTTNSFKMTYDNTILDYIKPASEFNLLDPDEFLDCCCYTNIQPLFKEGVNNE